MSPFLRTGVANLDKSRRHANHQFRSATITGEEIGAALSLTPAGVNMAGKQESGTTVLRPDGREYATRIDYEMLGNIEPARHAHLFPRYDSAPAELRARSVWFYDWSQAPPFDPARRAPFVDAVRRAPEGRGV